MASRDARAFQLIAGAKYPSRVLASSKRTRQWAPNGGVAWASLRDVEPLGTRWWWTQSAANSSVLFFPDEQGKYREDHQF